MMLDMLMVIVAASTIGAEGSSTYMAKLCRGQECSDPNFPILDYAPEQGRCICRAHPCWNDKGRQHDCSLESGFHLAFSYTPDRNLTCSCNIVPHYSSIHISKDLCPGQHCALPDYPVLDWDPVRKECLCRKHPCWETPGAPRQCDDPHYPILAFREDVDPASGGSKPVCECKARANKPKPKDSRLRGSHNEFRGEKIILSDGDRCATATPTSGRRYAAPW